MDVDYSDLVINIPENNSIIMPPVVAVTPIVSTEDVKKLCSISKIIAGTLAFVELITGTVSLILLNFSNAFSFGCIFYEMVLGLFSLFIIFKEKKYSLLILLRLISFVFLIGQITNMNEKIFIVFITSVGCYICHQICLH
jgi:hypothetical protein